MPNYIQYSTSSLTGSLKKGTVALGVTTSSIVGPTSITKWYSGITPNSGKYVIYKTSDAGDPDIFCPQTDQELYNFVIMQGGSSSNTTSVSASLSWISTQTNLLTANFDYENIVTDGLIFTTDAGFVGSYPTTGTIWYDLGGNGYNGTLTNGPTFNSSNSGSIVFDGTDDYVITQNTNYDFSTNANFTYCAWIYPGFSSASPTGRAVIDFTSPAPGFLRSYLRWEGPGLGFYFDIAGGGGSAWYTGALTFSANTWHYLCFTHTSSNAGNFYFDGIAKSTTTAVLNTATITNNKITIGYGAVNSYYWLGRIASAQIYNKTLTASEISQNYNAQKVRFGL